VIRIQADRSPGAHTAAVLVHVALSPADARGVTHTFTMRV
jgi:hypothetical protein